MRRNRRVFVAATIAALLTPYAWAQADGKSDPATWAPADALFFIGVADVERVEADYKKTAGYALTQDPAAKEISTETDFINTLLEKLKERIAKAADVAPGQLKNPFKGPLALYATAARGAKLEDAEPGLIAGVGDADMMRKYYDAIAKKMREAADKSESVQAGSNTIDVFTNDKSKDDASGEDDEEDEDGGFDPGSLFAAMSGRGGGEAMEKELDKLFSKSSLPPQLAMCLTKDRLFVGKSADTIKAAMRQDAGADALVGTEDYKALLRHLKPVGPVTMVLNLPRIVEMAAAENEESAKMVDALGMKSFRSIVGHWQLSGEEWDGKLELLALLTGERSGLAKILSMENRSIAPANNVPAETVMLGTLNLNILTLVDEIERIMRRIDPAAADQMHAGMEAVPTPTGETINLRKEVLENLREPLVFGLALNRPYNAESPRLLLRLGHKSKTVVEKLMGMVPPAFVAPRDLRGTQVYDFAMGGVSVAATADQIIVGNTPAVEAALQAGQSEGLAAEPGFKRVAKVSPKDAWFSFFLDTRRLMEAVFGFAENKESIKAAGGANAGAGIALGLLQLVEGTMKPDKLPEAKKLLKYYAPSFWTIATTPDGIRMTAVQLKPEKE